jgi:hypothetical protein
MQSIPQRKEPWCDGPRVINLVWPWYRFQRAYTTDIGLLPNAHVRLARYQLHSFHPDNDHVLRLFAGDEGVLHACLYCGWNAPGGVLLEKAVTELEIRRHRHHVQCMKCRLHYTLAVVPGMPNPLHVCPACRMRHQGQPVPTHLALARPHGKFRFKGKGASRHKPIDLSASPPGRRKVLQATVKGEKGEGRKRQRDGAQRETWPEAERKGSRELKGKSLRDIPEAKVYYPSHTDFLDPLKYIERIRPEAERYGIIKIVPPDQWRAPCCLDPTKLWFDTRKQKIHQLQDAVGFDAGERYRMDAYERQADRFRAAWLQQQGLDQKATPAALEEAFWAMVDTAHPQLEVEYGNDIDSQHIYLSGNPPRGQDSDTEDSPSLPDTPTSSITSASSSSSSSPTQNSHTATRRSLRPSTSAATTATYTTTDNTTITNPLTPATNLVASDPSKPQWPWCLRRMPTHADSVLRFMGTDISGVTVPWMYIGMMFATFCWHNEDDYLYSINYHHLGAPKTWYGVPGSQAPAFERIMQQTVPELFEEEPDLLMKLVTQLNPTRLLEGRVPVYHTVQEAGQIIVTFPKAYHSGFSHGFNFAEAVNFATADWFPQGREAGARYKYFQRASVMSVQKLLLACVINDPHAYNSEVAHTRTQTHIHTLTHTHTHTHTYIHTKTRTNSHFHV